MILMHFNSAIFLERERERLSYSNACGNLKKLLQIEKSWLFDYQASTFAKIVPPRYRSVSNETFSQK